MAIAFTSKPQTQKATPVKRGTKPTPVSKYPIFERTPGFGFRFPQGAIAPTIQPKLKIGEPNDKFEREADRVASEVMRMPDSTGMDNSTLPGTSLSGIGRSTPAIIQRLCSECEEEVQRQPLEDEEEVIQAKEISGGTPQVSSGLSNQINAIRGGDQPLSESVRTFFEPLFGRDFSQVRIRTDAKATESAQAINAKAYTAGRTIVFGAGQYAPETEAGKRLLAHELTHVVQQGKSTNQLNTDALQRQPSPANETIPSCSDSSVDDSLPDQDSWTGNEFLNQIRSQTPGENRHLLSFGSSGEPVALVQQALVAWGCRTHNEHLLPGFGVDGIFCSETAQAVRQFQRAEEIAQDGIIGPITLGRLDIFVGSNLIPPGDIPICTLLQAEANAIDAKQTIFPVNSLSPTLKKRALGMQTPVLTGIGPVVICGNLKKRPDCLPPECQGNELHPPITTTVGRGKICKAKECATALCPPRRTICLGKNEGLVVRRFQATDKNKERWWVVERSSSKEQCQTILVRERLLEDCKSKVPPSPPPPPPPPKVVKPGLRKPCERKCHFDFKDCVKSSKSPLDCLAQRNTCLQGCMHAKPAFEVCARLLQPPVEISGCNHAYVETPTHRYAIITPCTSKLSFALPEGGVALKTDRSPDPCDRRPTCIECIPKLGVTDLEKCFRSQFTAYAAPSLHKLLGPNSNTFAGTLARACCDNMMPKPAAFGCLPGWDDPPASPRTKTCPSTPPVC